MTDVKSINIFDEPEMQVGPDWAQKWGFDFYLGSGESRTDIRSGCVGADTRDEAEQMVRKACPAESRDYRVRLAIFKCRNQTWPRQVS